MSRHPALPLPCLAQISATFRVFRDYQSKIWKTMCTFYRASVAMHAQRDIVFTNSVRPSVCPMPVPCPSKWTYRNIFGILVGASFYFFRDPPSLQNSKVNPLSEGVKYNWFENFANITLYLGNGTRYIKMLFIYPKFARSSKWAVEWSVSKQKGFQPRPKCF